MVKDVLKVLMHMALVVLVVVASIPLWELANKRSNLSIADSYANLDINTQYDNFSYSRDNNYINKSTIVHMRNQNSYDKDYTLVLKIEKDDKLNYDDLYINVDGTNYNMNDFEYTEDNDYYYVDLSSGNLDAYTSIDSNISIVYKNLNYSNLLITYYTI